MQLKKYTLKGVDCLVMTHGLLKVIHQLGCRVKENSVGGDGVSKTLNAGEPSFSDEMHLGPRISPARKLDGVSLRTVVSDYPVLHPASRVGIF